MSDKEKKMPVKKFRAGQVTATVWENPIPDDKEGKTFYSTTIQKSYTEDDGKTWKNTSSFTMNDLAKVQAVSRKAYEFICIKEE